MKPSTNHAIDAILSSLIDAKIVHRAITKPPSGVSGMVKTFGACTVAHTDFRTCQKVFNDLRRKRTHCQLFKSEDYGQTWILKEEDYGF